MYQDALLLKLQHAMLTILYASAPILIAAVVIGLVVGLIQALTQIHDQTLPQAIKLLAALLMILMLGPVFARTVSDQAISVLEEFPVLTR
jgi:type III secretion protein S